MCININKVGFLQLYLLLKNEDSRQLLKNVCVVTYRSNFAFRGEDSRVSLQRCCRNPVIL